MAEIKVNEAVAETKLSKSFFYHLPEDTLGITRYGRTLRVDLEKFREGMRAKANGNWSNGKVNDSKL